jgi:putative sigma-54 modulation protein
MLRVTVSGRRGDVDEALRSYASEKASKLQRYYDRVQSVDVVFDSEASSHRCEVIAKADHHMTFVAKEEHADPTASLDAALRDLERQLTRHKEKFRNRKHSSGRPDRERSGGPPVADSPDRPQMEGNGS